MKKNIILLILLISTTYLSAQTLDFSKLEGRWDTTKTVQFEPAQYQIVYDYKYAKDAKYPDAKRTAVTILRIGTQHNMFIDYGQLTSTLSPHQLQKGNLRQHRLVRSLSEL